VHAVTSVVPREEIHAALPPEASSGLRTTLLVGGGLLALLVAGVLVLRGC
jgi:uncharacterized protein involved in exopolysaccharide biosynthesis